jgi:hypothetical protein
MTPRHTIGNISRCHWPSVAVADGRYGEVMRMRLPGHLELVKNGRAVALGGHEGVGAFGCARHPGG